MIKNKKSAATYPAYSELKRHLGFEYGGMILHEYYFGNLAPKGKGDLSSQLKQALGESFGSFDAWKADFVAVGGMRGVGWAVLYQDPLNGLLSNNWIELNQGGVRYGI